MQHETAIYIVRSVTTRVTGIKGVCPKTRELEQKL